MQKSSCLLNLVQKFPPICGEPFLLQKPTSLTNTHAMASFLRRQPFRALFFVYFFTTLVFFKIPIWVFRYLPHANRPRSTWTIKRCLIIRAFQDLLVFSSKVGSVQKPSPTKEVADKELTNAKFAWVEGIDEGSELFCGVLKQYAEKTGVHHVRIPGYWLLKKGTKWVGEGKAREGERTVLHLHGGAFYMGSAHPSDMTANLTRGLLLHSSTLERTFAVDYRLAASSPHPARNPFPAAVLDGLAAYRYLIQDVGFDPANVIIAGDSAGGNLAFALVRHLIENPNPVLPPPGYLLSVSTWGDLSASRRGPNSSAVLNASSDIFPGVVGSSQFGRYGVVSILGPLEGAEIETNRYLSPASAHLVPTKGLFKGFPPTYMVAGGAERLLDNSTVLVERMEADGVEVVTDFPPDAVHDFLVFTWHEPERSEALRRISRWIDRTQK
ncbi:Esterase [Grifola frondosa]|uniref:Esterase n=1 Tax=Grifola frondosa TaxID=5627 RepID=A0A1C7MHW9_GRIFR|nr:Esterase [Grifola frondosa]